MASTKQYIPRLAAGGMDRSQARHLAKGSNFWTLLNWKPDRGRLVETPRTDYDFALSVIFSQAASPVRLGKLVRNVAGNLRYLIVDQKTARYVDPAATGTQVGLPVITQSAVPNLTTVQGQCLMWGFNVTDFAAAADNYEVQIVSATTFQWRKNAGAWSAALPVATETLITANGLRVGFQDLTNHTIGATWKWTRSNTHPWAGAELTTLYMPQYPIAVYNTDVYIAGVERNIMRARDDFFTTVGYKRIYGKYAVVFNNHLVVGQYAPGVYDVTLGVKDSYNALTTPFTIGWSHLNNPDQFFSTDINEADTYVIPEQAQSEWATIGITGMEVWNNVLFTFLADAIYVTQYVGLPTVMRTEQINGAIGSVFQRGLVRAATGLYFIAKNGFYKMSGGVPEYFGAETFDKFRSEWLPPTDNRFQQLIGYYNQEAQEVCWVYWYLTGIYYAQKMIVFQERTGLWYTRTIGTKQTGEGTDVWTIWQRYNAYEQLCFGGDGFASAIYKDQFDLPTVTSKEQKDSGGTASFTQPTIETPWYFYGDLWAKKEVDTVNLDTSWIGSGGIMQVSTAVDKGALGDGDADPTYTLQEQITSSQFDKRCSFPRVDFRYLSYKFVLYNTNTYPNLPRRAVFNGFQDNVYARASE